MKLSVSLPDADVAFLDDYAGKHDLSRSAALAAAVRSLRRASLGDQYAKAWSEWEASGERSVWDVTIADGLDPE